MINKILGMTVSSKLYWCLTVLNTLMFLLILTIIGTTDEEGRVVVESATGFMIALIIYLIVEFILTVVFYAKEIKNLISRR